MTLLLMMYYECDKDVAVSLVWCEDGGLGIPEVDDEILAGI